MQCPAQQYAYDTLKEYPLEKWIKYRDHVYLLELSDGNYVILIVTYGNVPRAYKSWVSKGCSNIFFDLELEFQISMLQKENEIPKLKKQSLSLN